MSNFEIYVKTSALGKTGIHWRRIESEENQPIEKPNLIQRQVIKGDNGQITIVNDLIDEVKPSLLIFRDKDEKKLLLEVTGVESPQRSEKLGRRVLNSIALIAEDSKENEEVFRRIAYSAIQNILDKDSTFFQMIQESITFFELEKFRANLDKINEFIQYLKPAHYLEYNEIQSGATYKIEDKSTDNLEKLAEEILNHPLPESWTSWDGSIKTDGVIVVVTENLEQRTILHKAGVWRGFASRVEEPVREIAQSSEKKMETIPSMELPEVEKPTTTPPQNQTIRLIIMLLTVAITITLILISLKFLLQPQQTPQPQIQEQQILKPQTQSAETQEIQAQEKMNLETQVKQVIKPQPQKMPQL
jgi:hypothetical protein